MDIDKMNEIMRKAFEANAPHNVAGWVDAVFAEVFTCLQGTNPVVRHEMAAAVGEIFVKHMQVYVANQAKKLN